MARPAGKISFYSALQVNFLAMKEKISAQIYIYSSRFILPSSCTLLPAILQYTSLSHPPALFFPILQSSFPYSLSSSFVFAQPAPLHRLSTCCFVKALP